MVALRAACLYAVMFIALALPVTQVEAHRGHAVWTDAVWVGGRFEITHRMHLADAISANRLMGGREAIENLRSLARVALYVEERFMPLGGAQLLTLGAEIEDDFLFVYQEWVTPLPERFPTIDNSLLLDIEPDSQAFLKVHGPGLDEERERR